MLFLKPLIFVWDKVQREKKNDQAETQENGSDNGKEQENGNSSFSKRRKRGHREVMKNTKGKKWARSEGMNQEQGRRVRIIWAKLENKKVSTVFGSECLICGSAACVALLLPAPPLLPRRQLVSVTSSEESRPQPPPPKYCQHIPCTGRCSPWSE